MTPTPAPSSLLARIEAARIAKLHAAGDHRDCPNCRRFTARDNSGAIYGRDAA